MRLLAIGGYGRSGKDTAAVALPDWTRVAFADILRNALLVLDPIVGTEAYTHKPLRLSDILGKEMDWEYAKSLAEVRRLLQVLGTEVGRKMIDEDVWVNALFASFDPYGSYVITDCRFPNEVAATRSVGGKYARVTRPGVGPVNGHASETAIDHLTPDLELFNDGTEADFKSVVAAVVSQVFPQEGSVVSA